jgi:hypothetical protein
LHNRGVLTCPRVVHVRLTSEATGDEEQVVAHVGLHADSHPAVRGVNEDGHRTRTEITLKDVALEQIPGKEGGSLTDGDSLGGGRSGQDDHLGERLRGRSCQRGPDEGDG